jgi:enhancer of mRNA-decapping protein 3
MPQVIVNASDIVDLTETREDASASPNTFTAPAAAPQPAPNYAYPAYQQQAHPTQAAHPDPATQSAFTDPAIISSGRRTDSASKTLVKDSNGAEAGLPKIQGPASTSGPGRISSRGATPTGSVLENLKDSSVQSSALNIQSVEDIEATILPDSHAQAQKKKRRSRTNKQAKNGMDDPPLDSSPLRPSNTNAGTSRGKGWRQTPILQDTASFQPFNSLKRNGKARKGLADNGWASEDVTEGMAEFDFEGGLAKFDKRTLFDQMRKDDQVNEEDRLVSHNRLAKPGTAGGKNLHYSENVLELPSAGPKATDSHYWNSEADDRVHTQERLSGREMMRSAQSNRRADSKSTTTRRSQSRKASTATVVGAQGSRASTKVRTIILFPCPRSAFLFGHQLSANWLQQQSNQPGFYLMPSNRRLETVSALQMLNLENIAANEIGLTEDMMTENAGRGIAEVTLIALSDPAIKVRLGATGSSAHLASVAIASSVVILAGNNKSGIRAVAAGRHLRNKGVNILVCVVGIERERDLLEDMRNQIRIFKHLGGRIYSKIELFEQLRKPTTASSPPQVTLIIDALLGLAISFEELRTGDQATVYELIEWANRNEAFVLAVDVPTGIDPSTGKVSIIDGSQLYVKPRYVVAMGAPKRGLLEAMSPPDSQLELSMSAADAAKAPVADEDEWKLFITDMCLGPAVWKKAGTKIRRGIDFDDRWVLEMRYQGAIVDDDED